MKENCVNHPEKDSVSFCHSCKRHFCSDCLVVSGDYYYCRDSDCQVAVQNELDEKEIIKKDNKIKSLITKAINLISDLKKSGISPTLYFVTFGNGLAFIILSIFITKHVIDTSAGLGSVVIDVSFSANEIILIAIGILLFSLGIITAVKSFKSYNASKNKDQEYEESKINYGLGWICTFSGIAGLVIMIVMFVRKKISVGLQALSLIIIGIIAGKIIYYANPMLFIGASTTIYQFINPDSYYGEIKTRELLTMFLYLQFHYFIVPILLTGVVRFIGNVIQNRRVALETNNS